MRFRKVTLKIHLYLGVTVGLLFVLIGLTGSLLIFIEEIDAALNPQMLGVQIQPANASFAEVERKVIANFPDNKINRIKMPIDYEGVYEFWLNPDGDLRVYVNPYTAEITGKRFFSETFRGFVFNLHSKLLSGETGKTIIGIAAFFFLVLGISGIILWWRGWRKIKRNLTINYKANWKRINFDIHNIIGFFAFIFLSISAFTGIHLIFNAPFEKAVNSLTTTPNRLPPPISKTSGEKKTLTLGEIKRISDNLWKEAETIWIYPPAKADAAFMVRKKFPSEYHPSGKSFLYFDQYSGKLLRAENALQAPTATRFINNLYPIHIGRFGGLTTKVWQVCIGLTPAILFLTGLLMYLNRQRKFKHQFLRRIKNSEEVKPKTNIKCKVV